MANLKCKNENLTEGMVDAIAIFEWYLEILHKKYYGKDWSHALSSCELYYQCVDGAVILHIVFKLTMRDELECFKDDKYFMEHPKTRGEERDDHRAFVVWLTEHVEEFLQIAAECTDVVQLLELCDYREKSWSASKYGGGRRIPAESINWSIFQPDYSKITVKLETEELSYEKRKELGWHQTSRIEMSCDLTGRVRELLGDIVCRAGGSIEYYKDDYIDAKIYLDNWKMENCLGVGEAEYLDNFWVEFVNGKIMEFSSSEWGTVSFKPENR